MEYDLSRFDDFYSLVHIHPIIADEYDLFTPSKLSVEQEQYAGQIRVFLRGVGGASTIYEIASTLHIEQAIVCTLLTKMLDIAIVGKCKNRRGGDRQNVYALLDVPVEKPEKSKRVVSEAERQKRQATERAKYEKRKNDPKYKEMRRQKYEKRKAKQNDL